MIERLMENAVQLFLLLALSPQSATDQHHQVITEKLVSFEEPA